jgi:hypothetical protein
MGDLDTIVKDAVLQQNEMHSILLTASSNLYIVGGFLYRNIIHELYGTKSVNFDTDYVADELDTDSLPKSWRINADGFPQLSFRCIGWRISAGSQNIDICLFRNHATSVLTGAEPGIETYLKYVPLSIQSIAYDLENERLLGDVAKESISSRRLWFNNPKVLLIDKDYWLGKIYQKAQELGFAVDLSNITN